MPALNRVSGRYGTLMQARRKAANEQLSDNKRILYGLALHLFHASHIPNRHKGRPLERRGALPNSFALGKC